MSIIFFTSKIFTESLSPNTAVRGRSPERHRVVQKFEADLLVAAMHPGEEHVGNAGIGIDRVRQGIVDRLIAAELEAALPRALDELLPAA